MGTAPGALHVTVDLNPVKYQSSLNAFRMLLESSSPMPYLHVGVKTPEGEIVQAQVRHSDGYIIGFHGADGWYSFDDQTGGWGPACGVGSNYSHLGKVGNISYDDLKRLGELSRFKKGEPLDRRLIAILIAITAESARFATVATYFTGLTNSVGTQHSAWLVGRGVNFEFLKNTYFNHWEKPPSADLQPGQISHYTRSGVLLPHRKKP